MHAVQTRELYLVDADGGEEDVKDETEQELNHRMRQSCTLPTKAERERHEVTHLPFRNWCTVCMVAALDSDGTQGQAPDGGSFCAGFVAGLCISANPARG